jgi:light-regulated signal transduction histidine kinase (bacteriophytochrome)
MILPTLTREWFDLFLTVSRERSFIEVEEPFPALDRWYHITAFPTRQGRVAVVFRDITERREAEDERVRFTEELQRSNEELQRFAYVASHDLQEPLRSIISFSQLLARRYEGRLDTDADEYIGFIVEGGNRMQRLIEDLLQLSRIETTARPLEPTDAGEVVDGVLRAMETPIREAGATVEVEPLPTVMADAAQLAQVFTNLIANALKYRRPDVPPAIRISAERAGRVWRVAVADNGIGIEPEYYGRIFVIFQRLHTQEKYDGTGIGLAVVKKIVERHGGKVWVESTPGEGSTFLFTLPAV